MTLGENGKKIERSRKFGDSLKRRYSSHTFRYGYLVTT